MSGMVARFLQLDKMVIPNGKVKCSSRSVGVARPTIFITQSQKISLSHDMGLENKQLHAMGPSTISFGWY